MKNTTRAHLALFGTNLFFAINFTAIKYVVNGGFAKPFALNLVRVGVSSVLLWVLFFFKPVKTVMRRQDIGRFILCALTGIAINQLLFVKGLSLTFPIHASLLMLSTPILITVLAACLLRERLNVVKIVGLLAGIAGAVILVTGRETSADAQDALLGDVLILLNAIAYTVYFILVKPLMQNYNPVAITRIIFTIGFFIMLPFCWQEFSVVEWADFSQLAWFNMFIVVIPGTFVAYLFNIYGLKILGASAAGNYIYSQPFFAAVIAIFFFGESLNATKIFAAACIFTGVYLTNHESLKSRKTKSL